MGLTVTWSGSMTPDDLPRGVEEFVNGLRSGLPAALTAEAELIMTESAELVPVEDGILLASRHEVGITIVESENLIEAVMGYGGAARDYAVVQHETPPDVYSHAPGKSWKFLAIPVQNAAAGLLGRIKARLGGGDALETMGGSGGSAP